MSTLYLNSLQERLRPIARLVFPSDRSLCVNLCNTNQYTRLYLRRIIQLASKKPYELTITIRQLAQLFHVPYKKFLRWFRQDVQSTMVFRRVSHYLQEILLVIIYEELGLWDQLRDRNIPEKPIDWPSRKTMALWKQQADIIRKEYQNRGPKITSLTEAEDLIRLMQGDDFSSDSSESDDEDISHGIIPDEERASSGINYETTDSNALNGPPVIPNPDQLADSFKNTVIKSDASDNEHNDQEEHSVNMYQLLDQKLCFESTSYLK